MTQALTDEYRREHQTTRRVLALIPGNRLDFQPHERAMRLGQLGWHIATNGAVGVQMLQAGQWDLDAVAFSHPEAPSVETMLEQWDQSLPLVEQFLGGLDEARLAEPWSLVRGGQVLMTVPRGAMVRMLLFNHLYHHRGQLTVYLRMLGLTVPAVYGRSADEDPLGLMG